MFSLHIITIFYHLRTIRVNRRNRIALQVVDFYHSAYKRLYMPFRGIKWSSLFWQKKKRPSISRKSLSWLIPPRLIQYGKNNRSAFWHGRGKHMMSLFYHSPQYLFTERFEQALFLYRGIIERLQQLILLTASYRFDFPLALVFAQKFWEGFFPTGFITSSAVMSPICSRRRA